jgi:uncharacterized protein (TIGR03067 family)
MNSKAIGVVAAVMMAGLLPGAALRAADDAKGKDDAKSSADLKKLQGSWTSPSESGQDSVYTFKNNKLTVKAPARTYTITVKLDAAARPNKTMDMTIDEAPEDAKGKSMKAIYKIDGDDKFTLSFRLEGDRPEKFGKIEKDQFVIELKRKKE